MTEPMKTMTGPAQLRRVLDDINHGYVPADIKAVLISAAAAWDADVARADELERRLSSKTMALQEAEESVSRLQATKNDLIAEIKALYAARPTLAEWAELTQARSKAEAALERARALLAELEWCGVDNWLECPWCLGTKAEHYGEPAGHKPDCKLAALLAAASGGAA